MTGWDALPSGDWPDIAAALAKPWPRSACLHDLRWHESRDRMGLGSVLSRRAFAARWGWSDRSTRTLLASEAWLVGVPDRPRAAGVLNRTPSQDRPKGVPKASQHRPKSAEIVGVAPVSGVPRPSQDRPKTVPRPSTRALSTESEGEAETEPSPTPPARERKAPKPKAPQVDVKPYTDAWAAAYLDAEGRPYVWSKPFHRERAVFKKIAAQWPDVADAGAAIKAYLGDIKGWRAKGLTPQPPTTQAFASKMATYAQVRAPKRKATSADEAWTALRRKIDGRNGYALASPPRQGGAILWRVVKAPPVDDRVWAAVEAVGGWASVVDANEDTRAAWMAAFGGELGAR